MEKYYTMDGDVVWSQNESKYCHQRPDLKRGILKRFQYNALGTSLNCY